MSGTSATPLATLVLATRGSHAGPRRPTLRVCRRKPLGKRALLRIVSAARGRMEANARPALRRRATTLLQARRMPLRAGLRGTPPVGASSRLDLSWQLHLHIASWGRAATPSRPLPSALERRVGARLERTGEPALTARRLASTSARTRLTAAAPAAGVPSTAHAPQVATQWTRGGLMLVSRAFADAMPSIAARIALGGRQDGLGAVATRTGDARPAATPAALADVMPKSQATRRIATTMPASGSAVRRVSAAGRQNAHIEHATRAPWPAHPVEQVWRHATPPPDAASPTPAWRAVLAAAPEPAPTRPAAPTMTASSLDPAVAERLADDVVRRVERQLRIERERRGL